MSLTLTPKIYAYTTPRYCYEPWSSGDGFGLLKIGETKVGVNKRVNEQFVSQPTDDVFELLYTGDAIGPDGEKFSDKKVHGVLRKMGRRQMRNPKTGRLTEWFECTVQDVEAAVKLLQTGKKYTPDRLEDFTWRPEQRKAVRETAFFFLEQSKRNTGRPPKFLWNAKMRFGKTFAAYQLAKKMGWKRILILTYKPAVQTAWRDDLLTHKDFEDWQFIGKGDTVDGLDPAKPICWFASFQDVLGRTKDGSIKQRLEAMHLTEWDCVVLDEYHFGAWRETAKELYAAEPKEDDDFIDFNETDFTMKAKNYLYLSGTPFKTMTNGEFLEDQIFSWTYADEQRAKLNWKKNKKNLGKQNPYAELPTMNLYTYKVPDEVGDVAVKAGTNEFDLNTFFAAEQVDDPTTGKKVWRFKDEANVSKFLRILRGDVKAYDASVHGEAVEQPPMPFENPDLVAKLRHTFWLLPSVGACHAMGDLLRRPDHSFFNSYTVVVAAGTKAGVGIDALPPVQEAISGRPFETKTITLSCGKLTTGVTVPEWTGMFMLTNLSSPETYFQAAFRVQSPWTKKIVDPVLGPTKEVLKTDCYVFDFAPVRALSLVADYATQLETEGKRTFEQKVEEFLDYMPVLCFDGASFTKLDAAELLDFAAVGTGSLMLARKWESSRLVDISTNALDRLLANPDLLDRLANMEFFRNRRSPLREDLITTVNNDRNIAQVKTKEKLNEPVSKEEKQLMSEQERQNKKFRKELQDNLLKFVARIPIFMYLTDLREETIKDVITEFEPTLFKKTTGLTIEDFQQLCDLGVFNAPTMNEAVFSFRRFEDPSLNYAGGARDVSRIGGFQDTYATREEVLSGEAEKRQRELSED